MVTVGLRTSLLGAVPSAAFLRPRLGRGSVVTASGSSCPLVLRMVVLRMVTLGPAPGLVLGGAGEKTPEPVGAGSLELLGCGRASGFDSFGGGAPGRCDQTSPGCREDRLWGAGPGGSSQGSHEGGLDEGGEAAHVTGKQRRVWIWLF